ncbi:hypothetical protein ACLOJK_016362 [Asimina triloba]
MGLGNTRHYSTTYSGVFKGNGSALRRTLDVLQPPLPTVDDDIKTLATEASAVESSQSSKKRGGPCAPPAAALKRGCFSRLNNRDPDRALYFLGPRGGVSGFFCDLQQGRYFFRGHVDSSATARGRLLGSESDHPKRSFLCPSCNLAPDSSSSMAEAQPEKTPSLAEEKEEQPNQSETPAKAIEDQNPKTAVAAAAVEEVAVEKIDENSAAEESPETPDQAGSEEQEAAADEKPEIKLETAPADFRFPTTNQTRHCFTRYIEYHRCIAARGEGAPECDKFAKYYRSLCPGEWGPKVCRGKEVVRFLKSRRPLGHPTCTCGSVGSTEHVNALIGDNCLTNGCCLQYLNFASLPARVFQTEFSSERIRLAV